MHGATRSRSRDHTIRATEDEDKAGGVTAERHAYGAAAPLVSTGGLWWPLVASGGLVSIIELSDEEIWISARTSSDDRYQSMLHTLPSGPCQALSP